MSQLDQFDHEEELRKAICELPLSEKLKAAALAHYRKIWLEAEKKLNNQIDELKKQHFLNIMPLQKKSNEIISGQRAPEEAELVEADQFLTQEEIKQKKTALVAQPIEHFWSTVLLSSSAISEICSESDLDVLKKLKLVESEFDKNSLNFKVRFVFDTNEYFEEKVLEKEYIFEGSRGDQPVKTKQTKITWKNGKDLTKKIQKKKQRNKKTGQSRIIEKQVPANSFFQFFNDKLEVEADEDQLDEEEELAQKKLHMDYEIGQALIEEVIPGALDYFLGVQKDDIDMNVANFDEEGDFDEDENDDEDDEE